MFTARLRLCAGVRTRQKAATKQHSFTENNGRLHQQSAWKLFSSEYWSDPSQQSAEPQEDKEQQAAAADEVDANWISLTARFFMV